MINGTVKFFDVQRGFGFIQPEDGSKDAFVHITEVQGAGLNELREGQKVSYELTTGKNGKAAASNLAVID
ncbi:MAG: cold-shock protein [Hyphomicrobiaceae bacterium]|nr:cold-shock protein [Hyphomicrobiaceae bacterium]